MQNNKNVKKGKVFSYKNALTSPRKAGLLTSVIKGKSLSEAFDLLEYSNKKASVFWKKLLKSGVGFFDGVDTKNIKIMEVYVGDAPTLKGRGQPSARGKYWPWKKRRANLYVRLYAEEKAEEKGEKSKKAKKKS